MGCCSNLREVSSCLNNISVLAAATIGKQRHVASQDLLHSERKDTLLKMGSC